MILSYLYILAPALIALLAGLAIHSFIIAVNVTDWLKGRSVTPVDWVVTFLEISRICAQCAITIIFLFFRLFLKNLHSRLPVFIVDLAYTFFTYTNFWLTSLLSIVFCLKISNLRTRLFLYLRRMIEQRTVHFIVGSVLLSALNSLLPLLTAITEETKGRPSNTTMDNLLMGCTDINLFYSQMIGVTIPLLFYSISSVLLFTSLYHHIIKMKMSGNLSINLETYYSAMTFVAFNFMYQTLYFTGYFICHVYYFFYCAEVVLPQFVLGFLPVLHSSYLIYKTAKLRSQMSKVLQNVIDFLFQRKDPETREDIEVEAE